MQISISCSGYTSKVFLRIIPLRLFDLLNTVITYEPKCRPIYSCDIRPLETIGTFVQPHRLILTMVSPKAETTSFAVTHVGLES